MNYSIKVALVWKGLSYPWSYFSSKVSFLIDLVTDWCDGLLTLLKTESTGSLFMAFIGDGKMWEKWESRFTLRSLPLDLDHDEGEFIFVFDFGVFIPRGELKDFYELISDFIFLWT